MVYTRSDPKAPITFSGQIRTSGPGANEYTENTFTDTIGKGTTDSTPTPAPPACQVNDNIFTGIFSRRNTPSTDGKVKMKVDSNVYSPNL